MSMKKTTYLYALFSNETLEPFYIGKGSGNRRDNHVKFAFRKNYENYNYPIYRKIRKIYRNGYEVYSEILMESNEELLIFDIESYLIKFFGRKGLDNNGLLYNLASGGVGGCTGRSGTLHPLSKTVYQYDLDGNYMNEYESTHIAQRKTGIAHQTISGCCNGKYQYSGGYVWRFEKVFKLKLDKSNFRTKPVMMMDVNENDIKRYNSTKEAALDNDFDPSSITKCCKNKLKSCKGFKFRYDL